MAAEEKGFVVKDRRVFSQEGQPPAEETGRPEGRPDPSPGEPQESRGQAAPAAGEARKEAPLPQITFPTFLASLNASALVHLGVIEDPTTGKAEANLPMAKQTIDLLSLIQEKTAGNLTADEETMLKSILYDLRILYVKQKG